MSIHTGTTVIGLGLGTVLVGTIQHKKDGFVGVSFIDVLDSHKIGDQLEDDGSEPAVVIITDSVEALDVVIKALQEVKTILLDPSFRPQA